MVEVILDDLHVDARAFAAATGWEHRPEGLCRGGTCVPAPGALGADGLLDVVIVAGRLGMPLVHDTRHAVWALGPRSGGRALASAALPDLVLHDFDGTQFDFATLRGHKVVVHAWASW